MGKLFEIILPFAINLISRWLSYNDEKIETKQRWVEFVEEMDHTENRSKKIQKKSDELREEIFK